MVYGSTVHNRGHERFQKVDADPNPPNYCIRVCGDRPDSPSPDDDEPFRLKGHWYIFHRRVDPGARLSNQQLQEDPKVYAYYLGVSGGRKPRAWYSAFSYTYFWFNDAGIWENRALVAPWGEVYDVGLIEVWEQFVNRMAVRHGRVRVILKDGRNFVVEDVVEPDEILNFMREKYWRQEL